MHQLKIGIQLKSLRQPFKKALHTAARLGARAVEIDARDELRPQELSQTGLRQLRNMLEDLNLTVSAVGFPTRRRLERAYTPAEEPAWPVRAWLAVRRWRERRRRKRRRSHLRQV